MLPQRTNFAVVLANFVIATFIAIASAWPASAQLPFLEAQQQIKALNAETMEALRMGDYSKGISVAERALAFARQAFGPLAPETLTSLNNLASLYRAQGRHGEAEALYREALQMSRQVLGPRHPNTLLSLDNLAFFYHDQGRYGEAEPLFREALQRRREVLSPRNPGTLTSLNNLAVLYHSQGQLWRCGAAVSGSAAGKARDARASRTRRH